MSGYLVDDWADVMTGRRPQPSEDYLVIAFPDELRDAYLSLVAERPTEEVTAVLRSFLGCSRTVDLTDRLHLRMLAARLRHHREKPEDGESPVLTEHDRRVAARYLRKSDTPVWEGLTWVIDLLPHFPQSAIESVNAYLLAHAQVLPDLRITGLVDAMDLIRARFISPNPASSESLLEALLGLTSRDFEYLIAHLYREMGYVPEVTPAQKDGGKDVVARRGDGEVLYIECKNWRGRVDSDVVAGVVGRVETHRVTRGVIVGTSGFTEGPASATAVASESTARLTLLSGESLLQLMNLHMGTAWPQRLQRIIQSERAMQGGDT